MTIQILKRRSIEIEQKQLVGIGGEFKMTVRNEHGAVVRETPWFDNLVLDSGLNRMGTAGAISGCAIGTNATAPSSTDVALYGLAAYTTTKVSETPTVSGTSPYTKSTTTVFRFGIGSLNGNYSEVGVGWGSATMYSRALVVDGSGAPLAITVGPAEQLDVSYRATTYHQTSDTVQSGVTISGVSYDITCRPSSATTPPNTTLGYLATGEVNLQYVSGAFQVFNGALGSYSASPSGASSSGSNVTRPSYINNSLYKEASCPFTTGQGNLAGGISAALINTLCLNNMQFQFGFSPAIPKDATKTMSLAFRVTWARRP